MQAEQINIEHFFRLLYGLFYNSNGSFDFTALRVLFAQVWYWVVIVGYAFSILGFFVIIYATVKLFELRKREEEYFSTPLVAPARAQEQNVRWEHIQALLDESSQSAWREAITE